MAQHLRAVYLYKEKKNQIQGTRKFTGLIFFLIGNTGITLNAFTTHRQPCKFTLFCIILGMGIAKLILQIDKHVKNRQKNKKVKQQRRF